MGSYIFVFAVALPIASFIPKPLDDLDNGIEMNATDPKPPDDLRINMKLNEPMKECGRDNSNKAVHDYISGGEQTPANEYPWMVHFVGYTKDGTGWKCGGSLISDTVVLTALHCIENKVGYDGVKVGVANIGANNHQLVKVKMALWPHIPYHYEGISDIGILILEHPVDLSDGNIGTICLPQKGKENTLKGELARAIGWGRQHGWRSSNWLKQVDLKIVAVRGLSPVEKKLLMFTDIEYINGIPQDPCAGDSGGPLQYKENGRWTILGTLRGRGFNCKYNQFSNHYAGKGQWSKISPFLKWIQCVLRDAKRCKYTWRRYF